MPLDPARCADRAASFQRAAVDAILLKVDRALSQWDSVTDQPRPASVLVGGGVSANQTLREGLSSLAEQHHVVLRLAKTEYCVDNAAMIAGLAHVHLKAGRVDNLALTASAQRSHPKFVRQKRASS